tara:strand:- start:1565 stop:2482 length:918 start_codon:yes stop_codon:yes gene_type:complete
MDNKVHTTPKDFFLYLGVMVALYVSTISALTLLFGLINSLFPDVIEYYRDFDSQIRFSIAALIIVFPFYIYLTRTFNKYLRKHTEKADIWVRKWLIYLTLFVGGITIAIDLVVLVNTFLGGEITTRFVLKVLAVFIVVGAVFSYYLSDLRGRWEENEKRSIQIGWIAGIVILGIIVAGFFVMGSPQNQRLVRFDEQRVSDLSSIQFQVTDFWQLKERLPENLDELEDPLTFFTLPTDPETSEQYKYRIVNPLTFELCAVFDTESKDEDIKRTRLFGEIDGNFPHGAGETCFVRTIDPERFPDIKR